MMFQRGRSFLIQPEELAVLEAIAARDKKFRWQVYNIPSYKYYFKKEKDYK